MEIVDAHAHYYSYNFFRLLTQRNPDILDSEAAISERLATNGIDVPPRDPVRLADFWIGEMEKNGLGRILMICPIPGDEASLGEAVRVYPLRFIAFATVDPFLPVATEILAHAINEFRFQGIALYPSLHRFSASEEQVYPVYRLAQRHRLPIFIHFGRLKIPPYRYFDLRDSVDPHYENPADLLKAAADFPSVSFIIPHFGGGYFREVLRLGLQCPNVHVDTSSSNTWRDSQEHRMTLEEVFLKTLNVFGPGRVLFGSDSGLFPRGWRKTVFTEQLETLRSMGMSETALQAVFAGNIKRLLRLEPDELHRLFA